MYVLSFTSLTTQKTLSWGIRKTKLVPLHHWNTRFLYERL